LIVYKDMERVGVQATARLTVGGKSELHRAGRRVTPGGSAREGRLTASATESRPPLPSRKG